MNYNEAFKRARKTAKISQAKLAEKAGIHVRLYQRYEYGTNKPTIEIAEKIADVLNVSMDYLIGRSDNPERK